MRFCKKKMDLLVLRQVINAYIGISIDTAAKQRKRKLLYIDF